MVCRSARACCSSGAVWVVSGDGRRIGLGGEAAAFLRPWPALRHQSICLSHHPSCRMITITTCSWCCTDSRRRGRSHSGPCPGCGAWRRIGGWDGYPRDRPLAMGPQDPRRDGAGRSMASMVAAGGLRLVCGGRGFAPSGGAVGLALAPGSAQDGFCTRWRWRRMPSGDSRSTRGVETARRSTRIHGHHGAGARRPYGRRARLFR